MFGPNEKTRIHVDVSDFSRIVALAVGRARSERPWMAPGNSKLRMKSSQPGDHWWYGLKKGEGGMKRKSFLAVCVVKYIQRMIARASVPINV